MSRQGKRAAANRTWLVAGGAVAVVAVMIGLSLSSAKPPAQTPAATAVSGEQPNVRGAADAKVSIIEYGDYK